MERNQQWEYDVPVMSQSWMFYPDSINVCPYCSQEVKVAFDTGFRVVEVCGCEHQHELEPLEDPKPKEKEARKPDTYVIAWLCFALAIMFIAVLAGVVLSLYSLFF